LVAQHGALQLAPLDAALDDDLAVELRRQRQGSFQFLVVVGFGNPHRRAQIGGLDEHRKGQPAAHRREARLLPRHGEVVYHRQHPFHTDTFHHLLVHGNGGGQHARAHIRQVRQLEQPLHCAIFPEGAVEHREDHIDRGVRARLGQNRAGGPLALPVDKILDLLVFGGVHAVHDGLGRPQGHVVLAAAAAINHGDS